MSSIKSTYQSNIILGFKEIPEKDFSRQVYFIEKNIENIQDIDPPIRIELLDSYTFALFELDQFGKCVDNLEPLIYEVFDINYKVAEEDLFYKLLIRKADALYYLGSFEEAEHVSKELIKINPKCIKPIQILKKSKFQSFKIKTAGLRALGVMFLLFGLGITCFDLLVIQNFFPEHASPIVLIRNIILFSAGLGLVFLELALYVYANSKAIRFLSHCKDKKSKHSTV